MTPELVRLVARAPEALECLTPRQREVWALLMADDNVAAAARSLGIARQSVLQSRRLVAAKLRAFAEEASRGEP